MTQTQLYKAARFIKCNFGGVSQTGGGGSSTPTTMTRTWLHKADSTYSRARPKKPCNKYFASLGVVSLFWVLSPTVRMFLLCVCFAIQCCGIGWNQVKDVWGICVWHFDLLLRSEICGFHPRGGSGWVVFNVLLARNIARRTHSVQCALHLCFLSGNSTQVYIINWSFPSVKKQRPLDLELPSRELHLRTPPMK